MRCAITGNEIGEPYLTFTDSKGRVAYTKIETLYGKWFSPDPPDFKNLFEELDFDFDSQIILSHNYTSFSDSQNSHFIEIEQKFARLPNNKVALKAEGEKETLLPRNESKKDSTCTAVAKVVGTEVGTALSTGALAFLAFTTQKQNGFKGFEIGLKASETLPNPDYLLNPGNSLVAGAAITTAFLVAAIQFFLVLALKTGWRVAFFMCGLLAAALEIALIITGTYLLGDRQFEQAKYEGSLHRDFASNASNPFSFHLTHNKFTSDRKDQTAILSVNALVACAFAFAAGKYIGQLLFGNRRDHELQARNGSERKALTINI